MFAVIRTYTGASALMDEMAKNSADVEKVIGGVPGFHSYSAIRTGDGLTAVTVCADRAGLEESTRRAAAWVREHVQGVTIGAPTVTEGDAFIHFAR